jgi:hypothetical protein
MTSNTAQLAAFASALPHRVDRVWREEMFKPGAAAYIAAHVPVALRLPCGGAVTLDPRVPECEVVLDRQYAPYVCVHATLRYTAQFGGDKEGLRIYPTGRHLQELDYNKTAMPFPTANVILLKASALLVRSANPEEPAGLAILTDVDSLPHSFTLPAGMSPDAVWGRPFHARAEGGFTASRVALNPTDFSATICEAMRGAMNEMLLQVGNENVLRQDVAPLAMAHMAVKKSLAVAAAPGPASSSKKVKAAETGDAKTERALAFVLQHFAAAMQLKVPAGVFATSVEPTQTGEGVLALARRSRVAYVAGMAHGAAPQDEVTATVVRATAWMASDTTPTYAQLPCDGVGAMVRLVRASREASAELAARSAKMAANAAQGKRTLTAADSDDE